MTRHFPGRPNRQLVPGASRALPLPPLVDRPAAAQDRGQVGQHLPTGPKTSVGVREALIGAFGAVPAGARGALTWDQGKGSSVAIASNESLSGWTNTSTDPRLFAAIVDRLTLGASIIETGTHSYRLAHTLNRHGR